ncbi:MAG: DUF4255 domain-containing protein [Ilumatobacter sp.]|uniref:DUF4255 domain-containing protein n=1 Tax=Ilumatobacter sp. TaxID=1967498 RepID=UPI002639B069|nr:DUF4255 domain-containing protein [Ilumatobacter sp.]MDJ0768469.1 DUF4255 domain-containing protein [Ilumatobacter sp.]
MIHLAVAHVVSELNEYLNLRAPGPTPDRVVADRLMTPDGKPNEKVGDKVVAMLVNVEQDRVFRPVDPFERAADGTSQFVRPEINVNLYVLFAANSTEYAEALKSIAHVVAFFQHRAVFSIADPAWDPVEEAKVTFELFTLSFEQQNDLWGAIGAKLMPCVMYKAGLLRIRDTRVEAEPALVSEIRINE